MRTLTPMDARRRGEIPQLLTRSCRKRRGVGCGPSVALSGASGLRPRRANLPLGHVGDNFAVMPGNNVVDDRSTMRSEPARQDRTESRPCPLSARLGDRNVPTLDVKLGAQLRLRGGCVGQPREDSSDNADFATVVHLGSMDTRPIVRVRGPWRNATPLFQEE
jgi:hypothetical protein